MTAAASFAQVNGLSLEYGITGDPAHPVVLLVMGLGMPAAMWPDAFIETIVAQGYRVVHFDNRDCGGSSRLVDQPVPNIPAAIVRALLRLKVRAPYDLTDMASDAAGVMDAAGIQRAHVVGVSMGGMIAQVLAAQHPERVRSLTSIMSSTGNPRPRIALGKRHALQALLRRPPPDATMDGIVDHLVHVFGVIGSPGFPQAADALRPHLERVVRRGLYPDGTTRQLAAILASGDRRALLRSITAPTLVIHGADDPLVPVAAGRDTAACIPGARLDVIAGMGHDFPPELMTRIARDIVEHCRRSETAATAAAQAGAMPGDKAAELPANPSGQSPAALAGELASDPSAQLQGSPSGERQREPETAAMIDLAVDANPAAHRLDQPPGNSQA
jgi:pimeloyl-ACP methyl ester carboxylesterase